VSRLIPYSRQSIDQDDIAAVVSVLKSDFLTQGPAIANFETALAEYAGVEFCVVFSSGTAALHGSYFAAGLEHGDEMITSPITFAATSNAALYLNATPVFADVEPNTANIDTNRIKEKIGPNTKLIVPVHYAGHPADMESIRSLADQYGVTVIEDACHALGARYKNRDNEWMRVGSCAYSDMTILSFHPVKHIATGEGGAVLTKDKRIYDRLLMFRSHGITKNRSVFVGLNNEREGDWYYEMQFLGFNYRMTDIQAALGNSQLTKAERFVSTRREIAAYYDGVFSDNPYFDTPSELNYAKSSYHLYTIRLRDHLRGKRAVIFSRMREYGLGVQVLYIPVYRQPYYQSLGYENGCCPTAEDFYARAISIPIYHGMTQIERNEVAYKILKVMEEVSK